MDDAIAPERSLVQLLTQWLSHCPGAVVAFSGGVDSAVVAQVAHDVLGDRALAVTADSASLARAELADACQLAKRIGIAHHLVHTEEVADPAYQANDSQRCFHCKTHLFVTLKQMPQVQQQGWWILTGTNLDDLGDWRPGLRAAADHAVRSPLAELSIDKTGVRQLAHLWNLPVAEKPANPCLASRLAYGVSVTPQRLAMVEGAEAELRSLGLVKFRVRLHADNLARIEVPLDELARLIQPEVRSALIRRLAELGFRYVTLDLEGFTSGSLNKLIMPIQK
ncbi:MAG: ATP-dependent sacrificial sulfur transferase LarE [Pirellulaceae bacterium]|nr:ATP-dependent sacrificial sulfur transferase LarE [Pirellulaceae bacterium]